MAYKGLFALVVLSAVSLWALQSVPEEVPEIVKTDMQQDIDYFSADYSKVQMNQLGVPDNKVQADYVQHYRGKDETKLTRPVISLYKLLSPAWITRSETGMVTEQGEQLFLQGTVKIDRLANSRYRAVNIVTRDLQIQPNKQYAETDAWAELVTGMDRISGVGLQFFYAEPMHIKLLSQVRGRHEY